MQIEDILVGDKQLAKEILYDMRQAELAKEDDAVAAVPQGPAVQQSTGPCSTDQVGPSGEGPSGAGSPAVRVGPTAASSHPRLVPRGQTAASRRHSNLRRSSGESRLPALRVVAEKLCQPSVRHVRVSEYAEEYR